jgi:hypothetical protein
VRYDVYLCKKCGGVCAAREQASSFRCTYCGTLNKTGRSGRIASGIDSKNIAEVIGKIKMARAEKSKTMEKI